MKEKILQYGKRIIPRRVFELVQPFYHSGIAVLANIMYWFPSRNMKVIGVTGTKGKSTVVYLIGRILSEGGLRVATIGSLGCSIGAQEWHHGSSNTMPGRFALQRFLSDARRAHVTHTVIEVTSEGVAQHRHLGIAFNCAVFTNLEPEHIERHGGFDTYYRMKQKLFKKTNGIHVINSDDPKKDLFSHFPAHRKIFYGISGGTIRATGVRADAYGTEFTIDTTPVRSKLLGTFNISNMLAAVATAHAYSIDFETARTALEKVQIISGRAEEIQTSDKIPYRVIVDYAHTPNSLQNIYRTFADTTHNLICVLGAAGGGRDTWKRKEFGSIAAQYCNIIILTNEDPYDEDPIAIIKEIRTGIPPDTHARVYEIPERGEAIRSALAHANADDVILLTGKGSETSIHIAHGRTIPWDERKFVREEVNKIIAQKP